MTTQPEGGMVPVWTMGDRLRKARARTGLNTRNFAAQLGVSHGTITNAENDKVAVRPITLNAWSLATGVSREWLETGGGDPTGTPPPGDGVPDEDREAALAQLAAKKRARHAGAGATRRYATAA
jgi:transcriptional regulator with XRE-family HTH domain